VRDELGSILADTSETFIEKVREDYQAGLLGTVFQAPREIDAYFHGIRDAVDIITRALGIGRSEPPTCH
jgi:hypothetical protein